MEISIRFGDEISQTAVIPFRASYALLSGGDFLANGSVFPTLTGVPFDPSAVEQLCRECKALDDITTPGCTDINACNYNAAADTNDGTCSTDPNFLGSDYSVIPLTGDLQS